MKILKEYKELLEVGHGRIDKRTTPEYWGITDYTKHEDGSIDIHQNVDFYIGIDTFFSGEFPIKINKVEGYVVCQYNFSKQLTSFKNFPREISQNFVFIFNDFTKFKHFPRKVGGDLIAIYDNSGNKEISYDDFMDILKNIRKRCDVGEL
ncbi:MAG: hypothetical protein M0R03_22050 [Novosphingobium sp.]|jgi:hypothetical protein|nr:hypothetical protein [Novosphingobium sp.]